MKRRKKVVLVLEVEIDVAEASDAAIRESSLLIAKSLLGGTAHLAASKRRRPYVSLSRIKAARVKK